MKELNLKMEELRKEEEQVVRMLVRVDIDIERTKRIYKGDRKTNELVKLEMEYSDLKNKRKELSKKMEVLLNAISILEQ